MLTSLLAIFTACICLAEAQSSGGTTNGIPNCAVPCFETAISNTTCGLVDYYCQCTTGAKVLSEHLLPCLCQTTCSAVELIQVQQASNKICSAALSASQQTYTATSIPAGFCQGSAATATAAGSSGSSGAASATATQTGTGSSGSATPSGTESADSSSSASGSSSAAASTGGAAQLGMLGFESIAMGFAGMLIHAL